MQYPEEWNQLPKHERKKKIKALKRKQRKNDALIQKIRKIFLTIAVLLVLVIGYKQITKKTPEQIEFEKEVKEVTLDGKVNEFEIEGREHISSQDFVEYKTNPPTSGDHLSLAENWGVYTEEIEDKAAVHGLEHGGIWISYKDIDEESIKVLEQIGKDNSQSVIVSPRSNNDSNIVVASWGKMMKLESVDRALIQKYIEKNKNNSPEQIAK